MARSSLPYIQSPDTIATNLSRVLSRLEHKILSFPADPLLQYSTYERTKTSANLEYARTLLLRLEHDSSTIKIQSRKQTAQNQLLAQRVLIKRLTDRLRELDQLDDTSLSPASDEEDILTEYFDRPPSPSAPTLDKRKRPSSPTSTLRKRLGPASSTTSTTTVLSSLFPQPKTTTTTTDPTIAPLLESASSTQAALTTSLLSLATALKSSSLAFSTSLDADNAALNAASEGLEKNTGGMEVAGKRMGLLKRMGEGKGWWGRMMLYAWIGGLWVVAVALVFVGPKFRF